MSAKNGHEASLGRVPSSQSVTRIAGVHPPARYATRARSSSRSRVVAVAPACTEIE